MALTAAELTKDGELLLAKNLNTRLPAITDGLIAHFPFDGIDKGIGDKNLLDYSQWVIGTSGSQPGFSRNGSTTENYIIEDLDPWGKKAPIWEARPDATSGPDGGWITSLFSIDNTKLYRFSVWVKRKVAGSGRFYLGCYGYDSSGANVGVYNNANGTTNYTNPYFWYSGASGEGLPEDDWVLVVGHIFPHDHTDTNKHVDSGIYDVNGNKIGETYIDFRWRPENTQAKHRSYLYYSTDINVRQQWCYPRVDVCDGSEPTIEDLLMGVNGEGGVINPALIADITLTNDGVAIEQGTTNLLETVGGEASQDWSKWSHWQSGYWGNTEQYYDPIMGKVFKGIKDGASSVYTYIYDYYPYSYAIDDILSFSCYIRVNKDITKTLTFYVNSSYGGQHNVTTSHSKTITFKRGEWQYVTWTSGPVTETVTATGGFGVSMGNGWEGCVIEIAKPQFEKKSFSTSFINGVRNNSTPVKFNKDVINPTEGTISLWIYPKKPNDWQRIIRIGVYTNPITTDEFMLLYDNEDLSVVDYKDIAFGIRSKDSANSAFTGYVARAYMYEWCHIAITWSETSGTVAIFKNGELVNRANAPSGFIFPDYDAYTLCQIGSDYNLNTTVKDLSFYNRELTDGEIKSLYNTGFELQPTGDLISPKIEIRPSLPSDVYYFPLGADTKDQFKYLDVSSEANLVFEEGKVWVGIEITNLIEYGDCIEGYPRIVGDTVTSGRGSRRTVELMDDALKITTNSTDGSDDCYYQFGNYALNGLTPGSDYSLSMDIYIPDNIPLDKVCISIWNHISTPTADWDAHRLYASSWGNARHNEWFRIKLTAPTRVDADMIMARVEIRMATVGDWVMVKNIQFEERSFSSPFVNGVRGQGDLEFNLHEAIGLNWNEDWTIIYWKVPVGTHNNLLTGYSLESFGCNSNSVGGGYRWWGKKTGYNTIYVSNTGDLYTFNPSNYFNKEHMVSIVKSGNNVTWKFWDIEGQIISAAQTWGVITSDYFVTQYGYDLKLGGWDDTRACNTYFRDLITAKRALSDEELENIFRNKIDILNNKIRLTKGISTGQII